MGGGTGTGGDAWPVLHPCEVVTYDGDEQVKCGETGSWFEAPSGRSFYVCERHQGTLTVLHPGGSNAAGGDQ